MNVTVETVSSVKKKVNFEITADLVATEIDKVYGQIARRASIKGFRKGKVPRPVVEKYYSESMKEQVLKNLVDSTCFSALYEQKIYPVSPPEVESDDVRAGEPLKYSVTVEVVPEVEVTDYLGLPLSKEKFEYDATVVDSRLKGLQENMAVLKPAEEGSAVQEGDFVTFDFRGFVGGEAIENASAEDYQLEIGSKRFIPGFEEQLVGMRNGQESSISVTFPEPYGNPDLAGKEATFEVKIKEIQKKELPELDDDFARETGEFETIEQLRAKIDEVYQAQEKARIDSDLRNRLVQTLVDRNQFEVPEALVEKQLSVLLENMKRKLAAQRMTIEMAGIDEASFRSQYRSVAVDQVRGTILLDTIGKKEGISIADTDIDGRIADIARDAAQPLEKVEQFYRQNREARMNLSAQLREDRIIELILSRAQLTEVPKNDIS